MSGVNGVTDPSLLYGTQSKQKVETPYETAEDRAVSVDSFLQLMIAQLKNQDFTNPVDDTQYVTQLAQFATMQQMQELAYYSKSNYVSSMVGKNVTAATLSLGGKVNKVEGPVEKIVLSNKEFMVYVKGKPYSLSQIMEVRDTNAIADGELDKAEKLAIIKTDVSSDTIDIRWDSPTEDEELGKDLSYTVYYSTENAFDTVDQVKKGEKLATVNGTEELTQHLAHLEPDTTYYVNIVVKSKSGEERTYQKLIVKTEPE